MSTADGTRSALDRVFREEAGRLTASLVRLLGDFDLAEDVVAEATVEALRRWPEQGVPDRPGAWLLATARHKAIDRLRRDRRHWQALQALSALPETLSREPDDRGRLLFTCCHPALDEAAQVALTLRAVVGLTTAEVARAFLVPEATLAKRLTRAKRKIVDARIPYREPEPEERPGRLAAVLRVVYLVFNEGLLATGGSTPVRRELADDAEWLAVLVVRLVPDEPEPLALLALIGFHLARWDSRVDADGRVLLLPEQDRATWDRARIARSAALLARAAGKRQPGAYQAEAAIAAVHCEAATWQDTDWAQIRQLYRMLAALDPSPVVLLNQAIVTAELDGPARALQEIDALSQKLGGYHLFHATRADVLRRLGRAADARNADERALALTGNQAERELLLGRISDLADPQ